MITNYKQFWKNSFHYKGRVTRKVYWSVMLINIFISFGLGLIIGIVCALNPSEAVIICLVELFIVYCMAVLFPPLSMSIRRLRDAGIHWGFIFLYFIPTIGSILLTILYCLPTQKE
ncbi:DUF805 domain-containing protein [Enterococcus faecalis]|uniref:DUF805 domain-containing protein n=1 Tax=Enterococcus faecalis TaxID=1351 RepID=UPI001884665D|nr:DUF805 domain-containing protein [Enterococcus faecalis]MBE9855095.1 DUF805 domain-containing protein [Enterococcus faecalis]